MQNFPGVRESAFARSVVHHDHAGRETVHGFRRDVRGVMRGEVEVHLTDFVIRAFERQFFIPDDVAGIGEAEFPELDQYAGRLRILAGFAFHRPEVRAVGIGFFFPLDVMSGTGQNGDVQAFDVDFLARRDNLMRAAGEGFFVGFGILVAVLDAGAVVQESVVYARRRSRRLGTPPT